MTDSETPKYLDTGLPIPERVERLTEMAGGIL